MIVKEKGSANLAEPFILLISLIRPIEIKEMLEAKQIVDVTFCHMIKKNAYQCFERSGIKSRVWPTRAMTLQSPTHKVLRAVTA